MTGEWRATAKAFTGDVAIRHDFFNRFKDATSLRASLLEASTFGFEVQIDTGTNDWYYWACDQPLVQAREQRQLPGLDFGRHGPIPWVLHSLPDFVLLVGPVPPRRPIVSQPGC